MARTALADNQRFYISDGYRWNDLVNATEQFISLDLSISWTSDSPVWTTHTRRPTAPGASQGTLAAIQNNTLLVISGTTVSKFNTKFNEWAKEPFTNFTYAAFDGGAVVNTDTGLVYGVEGFAPEQNNGTIPRWRFTEFNPVTNNYSSVEFQGPMNPFYWRSMVYSKATKTIFSFEDKNQESDQQLWVYNISSKAWDSVVGTPCAAFNDLCVLCMCEREK